MTLRRLSGLVFIACLVVAGVSAQEDEFLKGAYLQGTPGLMAPKARTTKMPRYTAQAMKAKIQGIVEVQAVVTAEGKVDRVRVTQSLDKTYGLDEEALKAAKAWTFVPGVLDNKTVPVAVTLKLEFRLH